MYSSKAVAQEKSYAELPLEIGTILILVRKALPKSQKHLCQTRSREVVHKLILEPCSPGVPYNLISVPQLTVFPRTHHLHLQNVNHRDKLTTRLGLLKILWG